jgi:UTP pyrophosphatase
MAVKWNKFKLSSKVRPSCTGIMRAHTTSALKPLHLARWLSIISKMHTLKYLAGYPATLTDQIQRLIDHEKLGEMLLKKYPAPHQVKTDKALYAYIMDMKNQYLRQSSPISKIVYDDKIDLLHQALGLHSFVSRVQGGNLKAKNEIRIGSVFKTVPLEFLSMIAAHELAHLREKQHNKAFYKLCEHMEPNYHQLELDTRIYMTYFDRVGPLY